ncbi:MAG: sensor histidine kinase [Bacillota bacterium]
MEKKVEKSLKFIIYLIVFYGILHFEKALFPRKYYFLGIFVVIFFLEWLVIKKEKYKMVVYIFQVILIFFLEYNSKFILNYFIHILYLILIFEIISLEKIKKILLFYLYIFIFSSIKLYRLLELQLNFENISITFFILFLDILAMFLAYTYLNFKKKKEIEISKKALEERNNISRELHDVLGHNLTNLIMQLEMVDRYIDKDLDEAKEILKDCKKDARKNLSEVRKIVEEISDKKKIINIEKTIDSFKEKCNFQIYLENKNDILNNYTINRIIQEALTNIYKHSNASKVFINLNKKDKYIYFKISDNGDLKDFNKGFGLKNIERRVQANEGNVNFFIDNGFTIKGEIKEKIND